MPFYGALLPARVRFGVMTPRKFVCFSAALTLGAAWAVPAAADQAGPQGMWGLCAHLPPVVEDHASTVPPHAAQTVLSADYAEGREDHLMRLEGGVVIQRGAQRLWADRVLYDAATDQVTAEGHVRLRQEPLEMEGERGVVNLTQDRGTFEQTRYRYTLQHARGEAETITRLGPSLTRLDRATYTTCDPGRKDWSLKARRVYLHHDDDVGTAQHIVLRALDVPVFYFPYLSFPLSGARKTGFLWPSIGYGNETGLDISTPFYWNIAPHRDATLTPRYLQKRGLLAKGEFRYLNENSRGQLNLEYLPDDKLEQKNRASARYRHHHRLASHWQADIDANYVSDPLYFSQLGGSLSSASTTHVSRRLDVRYSGEHSRFLARAQAYQTVDRTIAPASRPYQQLPRLEYQAESPWQPLGIASALDAQWVRYYRADSVRGRRLDVKPSISWPYRTPGLFFEPKLSLEHTRYQLSGLAPGDPASPGRTVPLYSADAGVILEKAFPLGRRNYLHTLEPRLYFLRVPYRDQSELPVFDTSVAQLSYPQLFRDNRFTGPDRVGDAQQLSAGFTTRLIDAESGHEPLRFSVGRIFYFDDRRVQLSGTLPETRR
ncbi:MAG TPA: LPS-assembly protein LptD, partial [Gammaproteobacteria bacterium]|nr:LPS-assembly protein LptD [Gammaproteobacteria bacterium]